MSSHHGHDHDALEPPKLVEVADDVYAYIQHDGSWWINNAGFVVDDEGVVAVDTCSTEQRTRDFLASMSTVTDHELRVVVNTHHHGDHTHGNYLTHPAAIVGHDRCRDEMIAAGIHTHHYEGVFGDPPPDWGDLALAPPMLTFSDHMHVHTGDTSVELHYIGGPAHTTNDIVAWLPTKDTLFAGDLVFNGGTPFMLMGSVAGSLAAVERLRTFGAATIVPGHGEVCTPDVLDGLVSYYHFVQRVAADAASAGVTALEAARETDLGDFAALTDSERIVGNLHRAMFELDGGKPGGTIDIVAAIGDMIAFNDGRPLRCLA